MDYWEYEIEYVGPEWERICGFMMGGSFPCVLEPVHEGEHKFAGFYATYIRSAQSAYVYMKRGR